MSRVLNQAQAEAQRLKTKGAWQSSLDAGYMSADVKSTNKTSERALELFENDMKLRVVRLSTYAAAIVVRETAKTLLELGTQMRGPDEGAFPGNSMETGTFEKKSARQQFHRETQPSMVDKVEIKRKTYRNGEVHLCMVGPSRPWGAQAWILEWGGTIQLWGTSKFYHLRPRPFMEQAGPGTVQAQERAYIRKHRELWTH